MIQHWLPTKATRASTRANLHIIEATADSFNEFPHRSTCPGFIYILASAVFAVNHHTAAVRPHHRDDDDDDDDTNDHTPRTL